MVIQKPSRIALLGLFGNCVTEGLFHAAYRPSTAEREARIQTERYPPLDGAAYNPARYIGLSNSALFGAEEVAAFAI